MWTGGVNQHELLRIANREQPQHELIDQSENCGIGADTQSERRDRYQREQRAPAQISLGETQIREQTCHLYLIRNPRKLVGEKIVSSLRNVQSCTLPSGGACVCAVWLGCRIKSDTS